MGPWPASRMRTSVHCLFASLVLLAAAHVCAQPAAGASPAAASFESAWQELEAWRDQPIPFSQAELKQQLHETMRRAWDIFEAYPKDPRRWQAVLVLIQTKHSYIYDQVGDPMQLGPAAFLRDEPAQRAWNAYVSALLRELVEAKDVPPDVAREALVSYYDRVHVPPANFAEMQRMVGLLAQRFPDSPETIRLARELYEELLHTDSDAAAALVRQLSASSSGAQRNFAGQIAAQQKKTQEAFAAEGMTFVALDGRHVDVSAMHGKVVLIDFWATWCGPCIKELPKIKAAYDKYHAQGLEVIGVALDAAADRQKLADFVARENMPWPEHFDGQRKQNHYAVKFGVEFIPRLFLVDREGRLVSSTLTADEVDAEVRRLLGL